MSEAQCAELARQLEDVQESLKGREQELLAVRGTVSLENLTKKRTLCINFCVLGALTLRNFYLSQMQLQLENLEQARDAAKVIIIHTHTNTHTHIYIYIYI